MRNTEAGVDADADADADALSVVISITDPGDNIAHPVVLICPSNRMVTVPAVTPTPALAPALAPANVSLDTTVEPYTISLV